MKCTIRRHAIVTLFLLVCLGAASAASLTMPTIFARRDYSGLYTQWVQVADTNGDGIPDLIASETGFIEVLFGNGNGTFRSGPSTRTVIISALPFVATDLNGDGKVDLVIPGGPEGIQAGVGVCLGNGDGTFQAGTCGRGLQRRWYPGHCRVRRPWSLAVHGQGGRDLQYRCPGGSAGCRTWLGHRDDRLQRGRQSGFGSDHAPRWP
jgi:hypothetical protein